MKRVLCWADNANYLRKTMINGPTTSKVEAKGKGKGKGTP
jgi:hypothetical protein